MKCKKSKGFTLTEVLVVIIIVAVIAAIAYPLYTRTVNKSRATEAVNLLQMVKSRQTERLARTGAFYPDFGDLLANSRLTQNSTAGFEVVASGNPLSMMVGNYRLDMNASHDCLTATYVRNNTDVFTFSASYQDPGLGCDGPVCAMFGSSVVGPVDQICASAGEPPLPPSPPPIPVPSQCSIQCSALDPVGGCDGNGTLSTGTATTICMGNCGTPVCMQGWDTSGCTCPTQLCVPNSTRACGSGKGMAICNRIPPLPADVCDDSGGRGTQTCNSTGTAWDACQCWSNAWVGGACVGWECTNGMTSTEGCPAGQIRKCANSRWGQPCCTYACSPSSPYDPCTC